MPNERAGEDDSELPVRIEPRFQMWNDGCTRRPARGGVQRTATPLLARSLTLLAALSLSGCGNAIYAIQANSAASKLEEAHELGAEQYATYEYYMAKEHLEKARTEAAEADYGDAIDLSSDAEKYAEKAITLAREAHRGAGR